MRVIFRTDASLQIGTGHVMRCLTLANALREQGADCTFICRAHLGHLGDKIMAAGHAINLLPPVGENDLLNEQADLYAQWLGCTWEQDAAQTIDAMAGECDWLVVDHYGLDAHWESALRAQAKSVMVIDDLANRLHNCDLLLDQNLGRELQDYNELLECKTRCLIGPCYALLRPEFAELREYSLGRRNQPRLQQILITMGGVDKDNVTGQVLEALQQFPLPEDCRIVVVMGRHAPWLEQVRAQAGAFPMPCEVKVNVSNMAQLMADSDLAIGAAGSTSWERCCLGLPSITFVLAENQRRIAIALSTAGASITLFINNGWAKQFNTRLAGVMSIGRLQQLGNVSKGLADGQGVQRVFTVMETN